MSDYRTLNQTVLAKVEGTPGVDAVPVVGSDAVLVENPTRNPNLETFETNEVTGTLDDRGQLPAGGFSPFTATAYLKGGDDLTAAAPEIGTLLRGCAMLEALLQAAEADTLVAATASSVTLEAGASGVDGFYVGMPIRVDTATAQWRVITSYDGTSKEATVYPDFSPTPGGTETYEIPANALYRPTSTSLESLTIYRYQHRSDGGNSKLAKIFGSVGTFTLNLPVRGPGQFNFDFRGTLQEPEDVAAPGTPTFQSARPFPFLGAMTFLGGVAVKFNTLSVDVGNNVQLSDNPNTEFGYDLAGVTRRRVSGRINPPLLPEAELDAFDSWLNGTESAFWTRFGAVVGNRYSLYVPKAVYTGIEEEDVNGFAHQGLPFRALGEDSGVYICMH